MHVVHVKITFIQDLINSPNSCIYQIEIVCKKFNGHLGHALLNNTVNYIENQDINENHYQCVNSLSICYVDKDITQLTQTELETETLDLSAYASLFR